MYSIPDQIENRFDMPELDDKIKKRNVVSLGFVSMLNDLASEIVYPIVPVFLTTTLGAPAAILGLIEGIAEATASVLKVFSGWFSDKFRRRKPFVIAGYTLSALSKFIMAASILWWHVLSARFIDRFGKGLRSSARDALIADSSTSANRGASFGLHRALDTLGAVFGPLLALLLLHLLDNHYNLIFLVAAIPGIFAVTLLIFAVREPNRSTPSSVISLRQAWGKMTRPFRFFLLVSAIFALANSSDAFLILRSQSLGYSVQLTVFLYVLFNITYALLSFPLGKLSDLIGQKPLLILSFLLFSLVYAGFAIVPDKTWLFVLFPCYGIFMALSEGIGKAYIVKYVGVDIRGTALGLFYTVTGILTFFASSIAGLLWQFISSSAPFYFSALLSLIAAGIFGFRAIRIEN